MKTAGGEPVAIARTSAQALGGRRVGPDRKLLPTSWAPRAMIMGCQSTPVKLSHCVDEMWARKSLDRRKRRNCAILLLTMVTPKEATNGRIWADCRQAAFRRSRLCCPSESDVSLACAAYLECRKASAAKRAFSSSTSLRVRTRSCRISSSSRRCLST